MVFHTGTWGFFHGGGQTEKLYSSENQKNTPRRGPFNQPLVAGVFPQRNVGYLKESSHAYLEGGEGCLMLLDRSFAAGQA